jgi:alcohol dehydrogenase class IV
MSSIINYLTRIRFGRGTIESLVEEVELLGITSPLLVTDKGLRASGLVDTFIERSGLPARVAVFEETPPNPTEEAVEHALEVFRAHGCDGIIGLGGGSSIDLAKGVSLLATHEGPLRQYALIEGGAGRITAATVPLVAVPTTAGTGSEVGRGALITLRDKRKLGFISPYMIPSVAICDPDMTLSLPPYLTAATGMDAIAHCVETYLSPRDNPPADAIALDGLQRAIQNIHVATRDGANAQARHEMMMAAVEGALAFQKGLGAVHSLSHALGGFHELELHHGTLNALLMPVVLRFNQSHCEVKYARLREVMGLPAEADVSQAFEELTHKLDLPVRLRDMGVPRDLLDQAAQWAYEDHSTATNPRPATRDDFFRLLSEAY